MNALLDRDVDAAQAMTYNEWAQILEVVNPDTGELYQPEDFDVVSYEDTDGRHAAGRDLGRHRAARRRPGLRRRGRALPQGRHQGLDLRAGQPGGGRDDHLRRRHQRRGRLPGRPGAPAVADERGQQAHLGRRRLRSRSTRRAWDKTVAGALSAVNQDGLDADHRPSLPTSAYSNEYIEKALDELKAEGVAVDGDVHADRRRSSPRAASSTSTPVERRRGRRADDHVARPLASSHCVADTTHLTDELHHDRATRSPTSLDRAHVFHSWSAQGALNPFVIAGALGREVWDDDGHPLPRLLEPAGQHQHRPPASEGRRRRSRSRRHCCRRSAPRTPTSPAARPPSASSAKAGPTLRQGLLHQRRRGRQRERDPHGAPHDRPRQGALAPTAATTATPARPSSRPATGAACRTSSPAGTCTSSGRSSTAPSSGRPRPSRRCERALHHLERVIQSEGPASIAAILLEAIPGTAGVLVPPPGYLAGVRALCDQLRHRAHPRRGHVRLRPHRRLVRLASGYRRRARPDHLREGRELGLRARSAA